MKLLFLSICGKLNQPEETKYINLYLASLKKHVVPYFDVKVILLTTYKIENIESSILQKRIREYELENIVELKTINTLELSQKSLDIINSVDWFNRIGIHMNVLYDYSKRHNFFDVDWVFHVDTDIEFLENFQKCIHSINKLRDAHSKIVISLAGDSYPMNIINKDREYIFTQPKRINFYNKNETEIEQPSVKIVVTENVLSDEDHRRQYKSSVFSPYQMKIRNDFVGISKEALHLIDFNWVCMHYPYDFKDGGPLENFWPDKAFKQNEDGTLREIPIPEIHINFHMGGMLLYTLHSNEIDVARVQLPGYTHMVEHYSSGWFNGDFVEKSLNSLNTKFEDTRHVWSKDYE